MRRLPPLNGLRAFEAAGRLLSFTKAAEELNVTPAAVSQQVKLLEQHFGMPLFRRLTRALLLTDAGQRLLPGTTEALDGLMQAAESLRADEAGRVLTVSVSNSFGAKWLVPRLERFRRAHPRLDILVDATDRLIDFRQEKADVGIRYGRGGYAGVHVEPLMAESMFPVCSPELAKGPRALRRPEDLRHHTLLHTDWRFESDAAPIWSMWLKAAGVTEIDADRGPRFTDELMGVQEAIEGRGVLLATGAVVADDLMKENLVRPFAASVRRLTTFTYFLVHAHEKAADPRVQAFCDWIRGEFSETETFMGTR